jgi:hypothetical protein
MNYPIFTMSCANKLKKNVPNRAVLETRLKTLKTAILAIISRVKPAQKYYPTQRKHTNVIYSGVLMPAFSRFDRITHDTKRPRHFNMFDRLSVFRFNEHPRALFICKL